MNIKLSLNSFLIILLFISTTLQTSSLENTLNRTPFSQEIAKSKKSIDDYLELKKAKIPTEIIEESIKPPIEEIQKIKNLKNELNNETQNELNNIDNQIKEINFYETILNFFGLDPKIEKLYNKRAELKEQQKKELAEYELFMAPYWLEKDSEKQQLLNVKNPFETKISIKKINPLLPTKINTFLPKEMRYGIETLENYYDQQINWHTKALEAYDSLKKQGGDLEGFKKKLNFKPEESMSKLKEFQIKKMEIIRNRVNNDKDSSSIINTITESLKSITSTTAKYAILAALIGGTGYLTWKFLNNRYRITDYLTDTKETIKEIGSKTGKYAKNTAANINSNFNRVDRIQNTFKKDDTILSIAQAHPYRINFTYTYTYKNKNIQYNKTDMLPKGFLPFINNYRITQKDNIPEAILAYIQSTLKDNQELPLKIDGENNEVLETKKFTIDKNTNIENVTQKYITDSFFNPSYNRVRDIAYSKETTPSLYTLNIKLNNHEKSLTEKSLDKLKENFSQWYLNNKTEGIPTISAQVTMKPESFQAPSTWNIAPYECTSLNLLQKQTLIDTIARIQNSNERLHHDIFTTQAQRKHDVFIKNEIKPLIEKLEHLIKLFMDISEKLNLYLHFRPIYNYLNDLPDIKQTITTYIHNVTNDIGDRAEIANLIRGFNHIINIITNIHDAAKYINFAYHYNIYSQWHNEIYTQRYFEYLRDNTNQIIHDMSNIAQNLHNFFRNDITLNLSNLINNNPICFKNINDTFNYLKEHLMDESPTKNILNRCNLNYIPKIHANIILPPSFEQNITSIADNNNSEDIRNKAASELLFDTYIFPLLATDNQMGIREDLV